GLVELDQVDAGEGEPGAVESGGGCRDRTDAHGGRRHPGDGPGDEPDQGAQPEVGGLLGGGDDADGGAVVLSGGVARGHGGVGILTTHDGPQPAENLDGGVGADVLVAVDDGVALSAADGHLHDLVGEAAHGLGCGRTLMGGDGELVLLG